MKVSRNGSKTDAVSRLGIMATAAAVAFGILNDYNRLAIFTPVGHSPFERAQYLLDPSYAPPLVVAAFGLLYWNRRLRTVGRWLLVLALAGFATNMTVALIVNGMPPSWWTDELNQRTIGGAIGALVASLVACAAVISSRPRD